MSSILRLPLFFRCVLFIFCPYLCARLPVSASPLPPQNMQCEYLHNPLGIDSVQPELSWVLPWKERDAKQSYYQIEVSSSKNLLNHGRPDLWNTGKKESASTYNITYKGIRLNSDQSCFWRVKCWNELGQPSGWSSIARWSMGLLQPSDWKAHWIASNNSGKSPVPPTPMPIFRTSFSIFHKVKRATVYVCGLGQFKMLLNGKKVGDHVLDPGWTDYYKRCLYVTFDVTKQLVKGKNAIGVMLGNGMYHVKDQRYMKFVGSYGPPKLILQMDIHFTDGTQRIITSNGSWETAPGPITLSSIYDNEDYDARLVQPGWATANFVPGSSWHSVAEVQGPGGKLRAQMIPAIKVIRTLKPVHMPVRQKDSSFVYDFGQNMSGRPEISVSGKRGSVVRIKWGELLKNGQVSQDGVGYGYYQYTLRGNGVENWAPTFSYTGFRYLQVYGAAPKAAPLPDEPVMLKLSSQYLYPDSTKDGYFSCSNPLLNKIHHIIVEAIESNTKSIMTDCPTREKLGWLEEDHLMGRSLLYNFNLHALFRKITADMREAQRPDGLVPDIAPEFTKFSGDFRDSPEWGSSSVMLPYLVYQQYGDKDILAKSYIMMKRYAAYLHSRSIDNLVKYGLGDWYDIGPGPPGYSQNTPQGVTATVTYYQDLNILRKTALLLNHPQDALKYQNMQDDVKAAFQKAFFHSYSCQIATGSQCADAMAIESGMLNSRYKSRVLSNLIADIRAHNNHTTAGEVGFHYIVRALSEEGRSDVLYDMATRTDSPSYGYQIVHGATTLTEAWDGPTAGNSQNHFMLGDIDQWFFQTLAGIHIDMSLHGNERIVIKPAPVKKLQWAKASYESVVGLIGSGWRWVGNKLILNVTIPCNCSADVYIPCTLNQSIWYQGSILTHAVGLHYDKKVEGYTVFRVDSGQYSFEVIPK